MILLITLNNEFKVMTKKQQNKKVLNSAEKKDI